MVTFDHRQVLISGVLVMQLLCMVRHDEVVFDRCNEVSRNESLLYVVDWVQLGYVEARFVLDSFPDKLHGR